jgi:hypothetical protein
VRNRIVSILGAVVLSAVPLAALGAGDHAPPTLTPLAARALSAACPGTSAYADALVRGAAAAEAAAAAPLFDSCAAAAHRDFDRRRETAANVGVGAAYLSRGLLGHDAAMLRRAIDATASLRSGVPATDETIRQWPIIPDEYDVLRHQVVIRLDCNAGVAPNAAYINVAARQGSAWIATPRESEPCLKARIASASRPVDFEARFFPSYQSWSGPFAPVDPHARPNSAIEVDDHFPGLVRPL